MEEKFRFIENKSPDKTFEYVVYDHIDNGFPHKMGSSRLLQIYFFIDGQGSFHRLRDAPIVKEGQILFVNPLEESGFSAPKSSSLTFVGFGLSLKEFRSPNGDSSYIAEGKDDFLPRLALHIHKLAIKNNFEMANSYFSLLLKELAATYCFKKAEGALSKERELIRRVKEYLDANVLNKIKISDLSAHFYCSNSSLLHSFKKVEGVTILEYVQRQRLELAQYFLRTGNRKIADICIDVGFSSTQFFYSYFTKNVGMTPNKYRALYGERNQEKEEETK